VRGHEGAGGEVLKKDNIRDYATEAFRFYALKGKPAYEDMRREVEGKAGGLLEKELNGHSGNVSNPTEYEVLARENALQRHQAELLDILAVNKVISMLEVNETGQQVIKAVEAVYFPSPFRYPRRGEISQRVLKASEEVLFCNPATVYRHLRHARTMFAMERGLRIL